MSDDRSWVRDVPRCDFNNGGPCIANVYEACQCKSAAYQLFKKVRLEQSSRHCYVPDAMAMGDCRICGRTELDEIHNRK